MSEPKKSETAPDAPETVETIQPEKNQPENRVEIKYVEIRSIQEIIKDLSKPVKWRHLSKRKQGGKDVHYLSWHDAVKYMDLYASGWLYEIRRIDNIAGKLILTTRVSIPCAEGVVYREATGQEDETKDTFGDSSSNAESMSLRRACAKFGLGLYLYDENGWKLSLENPPKDPPKEPAKPAEPKTETPKDETPKDAPKTEAKGKTKPKETAPPEGAENDVAISDEQLKVLIGLCENPPKRKEPCDKNKVAKHYSNNRTEMLEDLSAAEAVRAIDAIRVLDK